MVNIKNKVLPGFLWKSIQYSPQETQELAEIARVMSFHETLLLTKERKHFFKIGCHLRYPIFVSFATFVVTRSTRQYLILHTESLKSQKIITANIRAIDCSAVRRYSSRQRKRVLNFLWRSPPMW